MNQIRPENKVWQDFWVTLNREHNNNHIYFHYVKPARDKSECSTKCHLWHIIEGSKCLDSRFRKKLLTAGDDETERIRNYSGAPQNLLNLLQPGACSSPSPRENASGERTKESGENKVAGFWCTMIQYNLGFQISTEPTWGPSAVYLLMKMSTVHR